MTLNWMSTAIVRDSKNEGDPEFIELNCLPVKLIGRAGTASQDVVFREEVTDLAARCLHPFDLADLVLPFP